MIFTQLTISLSYWTVLLMSITLFMYKRDVQHNITLNYDLKNQTLKTLKKITFEQFVLF